MRRGLCAGEHRAGELCRRGRSSGASTPELLPPYTFVDARDTAGAVRIPNRLVGVGLRTSEAAQSLLSGCLAHARRAQSALCALAYIRCMTFELRLNLAFGRNRSPRDPHPRRSSQNVRHACIKQPNAESISRRGAGASTAILHSHSCCSRGPCRKREV